MERIDDLQFQNLHIVQDDETACFTADAVLLADFLRVAPRDTVVDLGSGNGILCILGAGKTGAQFVGVEKQARLVALAERSAKMNQQPLRFLLADAADAPKLLGHGTFTAAVCNPPYFDCGEASPNASRSAARHGQEALGVLLHAAFLLLKNGGRFFCCFPTARLIDLLALLRETRLEPKRMQLVAPKVGKPPYLALIECKKLAKPGLKLEPLKYFSDET